jgi:hypothetical protein
VGFVLVLYWNVQYNDDQNCVYSQSFHDQNIGSITRLVSKREKLLLLARRQANVIPLPDRLHDTSFCVGSA